MSVGTYSIDGVPLDDSAGRWVVSDETQLRGLPGLRVVNVAIPRRHGNLPLLPDSYDVGTETVGVLVTDNNAAGAATGDHQQLRRNLRALLAMAAPVTHLPTLGYHEARDGGTGPDRVAAAQLAAVVEPVMHDEYTATVVLPFTLPGVFWRDPVAVDVASAAVAAWPADPNELAGSTAPITDPTFVIEGPVTGVTITDAASGTFLEWSGDVPAGSWVRIDAAALSAHTGTGTPWTGGTDVSGGLAEGPVPFALTPNSTTQRVAFDVARTGGAGINRARARRSFL